MSFRTIMAGLRTMGTEQNRKLYARHGVGKKMYGVSYANLNKLRRQIGTDHALAQRLWASGNHDARVLATMVADPAAMRSSTLDSWARDLDNYSLADAFGDLVSRTPFARNKFEKWSRSRAEFVGQVGWRLLSYLAGTDQDLNNTFFLDQIKTIEAQVHNRANRVRHSMNGALISIGARNATLRRRATAAANRIGPSGSITERRAALLRRSFRTSTRCGRGRPRRRRGASWEILNAAFGPGGEPAHRTCRVRSSTIHHWPRSRRDQAGPSTTPMPRASPNSFVLAKSSNQCRKRPSI